MAKIYIPHTKCEKGQTKSFLTGSAIFSYSYTSWKLGSSLSCKLPIYNICYLHVCGTEGRGTWSHHRVCWPYHTPKHMAHRHSVRRRTLENMTEMMILICIVLAYKPRFSCARQTLPVWKHNGRALLTLCIRNASALLTRRSRLQCETAVRRGRPYTFGNIVYICITHPNLSMPMLIRVLKIWKVLI